MFFLLPIVLQSLSAFLLSVDLVDYLLEEKILISLGRVELDTLGVTLACAALDKCCQEGVGKLLLLGLDYRCWWSGRIFSLGGLKLVLSPVLEPRLRLVHLNRATCRPLGTSFRHMGLWGAHG